MTPRALKDLLVRHVGGLPYFAAAPEIKVISDEEKDIMQVAASTTAKLGLVCVVSILKAGNASTDCQTPFFRDVVVSFQFTENRTLNLSASGTGETADAAAAATLSLLHMQPISGLGALLSADAMESSTTPEGLFQAQATMRLPKLILPCAAEVARARAATL